ncbi:NAD(P)/FAD-dependent oxidoreductase [Bacillus gobiensis]|uniref:flavin-containing monooxygenase n=1 Tax=Bacillus gobiensis TaxID=1441095 RepID=UPI003D20E866
MFDVVVVGAGQAGLAMGYYLKQKNLSFVLLDANNKIGDSWRKRYESLVLFTNRNYSSLPGLKMSGDQEGYPSKNEMADYLEQYVSHFDLPVKTNTPVIKVEKKDDIFIITTNQGNIQSTQVIIASGAFQKPFIPAIVKKNGETEPFQIHSSSYDSPKQLNEGSVLVVGGGNSGAQIAVELAKEKSVTLAVSHPLKFLPLRFLGKSTFHWLDFLGLLYVGINTKKGKWFSKQSDPIFGYELKKLIKENKIDVKPRVIKIEGNQAVFEDNSISSFENIIWSTGFISDYDWIDINGALKNGKPVHERGKSPVKGLFFIGLPWQYQRGSALICGVGKDAEFLIEHIKTNSGSFKKIANASIVSLISN